jgi:diguanylate cyclase (GGDEF)-like protein/PAS domain S-box-containing protein
MPDVPPDDSALPAEIERLHKVITALVDRAEGGSSERGSDFNLFEMSVILEDQVKARTKALESALSENERIRRDLSKSEAKFSAIFSLTPDPIALTRLADGVLLEVSDSFAKFFGFRHDEVVGRSMSAADIRLWVYAEHRLQWKELLERDGEVAGLETSLRRKDGSVVTVLISGKVVEIDGERCVIANAHDISERHRSDARERLRSDILEKLARGLDLPALFDTLVRGIEAEQPGCVASIMLVDDEGRLRTGAAPNLPESYLAAMDGRQIGDGVGSCGTAAFRGELVVVEDIQNHPYWVRCRSLAASADLAACWSQPVFDARGSVVATIAMYSRTPRGPSINDIAYLLHAANVASIAISHHRDEKQLQMAMQALQTTRECVYWIDQDGRMLYVNPATEQELGYPSEELLQMSIPDIDPNTPPELWGPEGELTRRLNNEGLRKFVTAHRHRDGHLIPIEVDSDAFHYDGQTYFIAIVRDISARLAAEDALRKSEAKFSAIFNLTPDPIALTRLADGVVVEVSRSFARYFGYSPDQVVGRSTLPGDLGLWVEAKHRRQWQEQLERDGESIGYETPMRRVDGSVATVLISGKVVDIGGERCVIADIHDITEHKQHADRMEQIAQHDALTGLPNRLLLGDRLQQAIAQSRREGKHVAVCYLDLDGFKDINDRLGHEAGDQVLVDVAARLSTAVRGGDTVARLGGDEFVVLLANLANDEECQRALDRMLQACAAPYVVGGSAQTLVSVSIGVTMFPTDPADPDTLVRHADHAMYVAKQAGKNRYQMFDTRLEQRIEARHATLRHLAEAMKAGQFLLHFQPKVNCRHGHIVGAEALIRWQHPTLGRLSPAEFVPLIEDTDLAIDVGDWVIRETLAQIVRWRQDGIDIAVSVNAFTRQLLHPDFVGKLAADLAKFPQAGPSRLQIEIVETAALNELDSIRLVIEECLKLGVTFSLDDFGTGYSTLAHLRHLPATEIKIDQSFVGHMLERGEDLVIVEAVIGLGHAFGRSIVAEGAETLAHINRLMELGCDVIQGYALARPLAADDFLRWVVEFRPDPAWHHPPNEPDAV